MLPAVTFLKSWTNLLLMSYTLRFNFVPPSCFSTSSFEQVFLPLTPRRQDLKISDCRPLLQAFLCHIQATSTSFEARLDPGDSTSTTYTTIRLTRLIPHSSIGIGNNVHPSLPPKIPIPKRHPTPNHNLLRPSHSLHNPSTRHKLPTLSSPTRHPPRPNPRILPIHRHTHHILRRILVNPPPHLNLSCPLCRNPIRTLPSDPAPS